jgi:hypothetical protein
MKQFNKQKRKGALNLSCKEDKSQRRWLERKHDKKSLNICSEDKCLKKESNSRRKKPNWRMKRTKGKPL